MILILLIYDKDLTLLFMNNKYTNCQDKVIWEKSVL